MLTLKAIGLILKYLQTDWQNLFFLALLLTYHNMIQKAYNLSKITLVVDNLPKIMYNLVDFGKGKIFMEENKKEEKKVEKVGKETKTENKEQVKKEETKKVETKKEETKKEVKEEKTSELKNEASETVKKVKEQMKEVDIKEEAKIAKGFVTKLATDPIKEVEEIAKDPEGKNFKTAIILVIIWTVAAFLTASSYIFSKYFFTNFGSRMLSIVKTVLTPSLFVISMSLVIFFMTRKNDNKKSLVSIITTVTTTFVPIIIAKIISILTLISTNVTVVTSRITSVAVALSCVMQFFAVKAIFDKKDNKEAFKAFAIIEGIFFLVSLALSFLGISILY